MRVTVIPIIIGALGRIPPKLIRELEDLESEEEMRPSKLLNVEINPNPQNSPKHQRGPAITQTPV